MTLKLVLEESVVQELMSRGISPELFRELRDAPTFDSVPQADAFLDGLCSKYYDSKEWARQGVWLDRQITDGDVGMIGSKTSYTLQSITDLPLKITVVEGNRTTVDRIVDKLPLHVAIAQWMPDKVAGYIVPNGK